jgi:hypothetical protein
MTRDRKTSFDSLIEANRDRAKFSGHGDALGAAGVKEKSYDPDNSTHLRKPGESLAITPGEGGFKYILIGAAWENIAIKKSGLFSKAAKKRFEDRRRPRCRLPL